MLHSDIVPEHTTSNYMDKHRSSSQCQPGMRQPVLSRSPSKKT